MTLFIEIILTSLSSAESSDPGFAIERTIIDSEAIEFVNERDVVKTPAAWLDLMRFFFPMNQTLLPPLYSQIPPRLRRYVATQSS